VCMQRVGIGLAGWGGRHGSTGYLSGYLSGTCHLGDAVMLVLNMTVGVFHVCYSDITLLVCPELPGRPTCVQVCFRRSRLTWHPTLDKGGSARDRQQQRRWHAAW